MNEDDKETYRMALVEWGQEAQLMMIMEEMAELQKEIVKVYRGHSRRDKLAEEIADVQIMLEQLQFMENITPQNLEEIKEEKIQRLKNRLTEKCLKEEADQDGG